jgi:hypothetical protein
MMARESYIGLKTFTSDRHRRNIGIKARESSAFDRPGALRNSLGGINSCYCEMSYGPDPSGLIWWPL